MFAPIRLFFSLRRNADLGLLFAVAAVAVLFAATPFLIPAVASEFDVSVGTAGLLSTAQVAGFALTVLVAGRRFRTHRRFLVWSSLAGVALNLGSVVVPSFPVLLVVGAGVGVAAGLLTWLGWANAMASAGAMRNVAAVGPLAALVASPLLAWSSDRFGSGGIFVLVALAFLPALVAPARFAGRRVVRRRMSPSRSNVVLLGALGLLALAGSSLFVYGASIGTGVLDLSPLAVSLGYSGNALVGVFAARRPAGDRPIAGWVYAIAGAAALVAFAEIPLLFMAGLIAWGAFYWLAVPPILRAIAAWSLVPEERVGDAQSIMAAGRAIGPAIGGVLIATGSFASLGVFAVAGTVVSGVVVTGVRRYRLDREPPTESPAPDLVPAR